MGTTFHFTLYTFNSLYMFQTILSISINIVVFLFMLGILVLVHEFGHFWVARKCGVKVEEFAFGLPPRLWAIKRGGTEYAINAIPFGGYVKMLGQDDFDPKAAITEKSADHFESKRWWQKALILCAGVAMNIILAIVLLGIGYTVGMKPIIPDSPIFNEALQHKGVVIREIHHDSLAEKLNIPTSGTIQQIDGLEISTTAQLHNEIAKVRDKGFALVINNNTYNIPPLKKDELIGIAYGDDLVVGTVQLPIHKAFYFATVDSMLVLRDTFTGLGSLVTGIFTKFEVSQDVTGPIGIFKITSEVSRKGIIPYLQLIALLSLSLAAVNIIPFPALDGGRLLFVILEAILPVKWNKLIEGKVHLIGMIFLLIFMLAITYKDIIKLFG